LSASTLVELAADLMLPTEEPVIRGAGMTVLTPRPGCCFHV
jgi:hypothetical protein